MTFGLAFLAGAIGTLSPCVLPVLPIIMGSTRQAGIFGPLVLALGLIVSFTAVGYLVASIGYKIGVTQERIAMIASAILIVAGLFMYFGSLQGLLDRALGRFSNSLSAVAMQSTKVSYKGQFLTGILLGGIWSPCTGPTLGIAISLASSQDKSLRAISMMALYGVGSAVPLMLAAYSSNFLFKRRSSLASAVQKGKKTFGFILMLIGGMLMTGMDKVLEGSIVAVLPDSFVEFISKY